jgi:hypothetical protein
MTEERPAVTEERKKKAPLPRIALWVMVGLVAGYSLISGVIGILAKA